MRYLFSGLITLLLLGSLFAQRKITLDVPVQARAGASEFVLNSFHFDQAGKQLVIGFREVNGDRSMTFTYNGPDFDTAYGFIVGTAVENKILLKLQNDGKLGSTAP